MSRAAVENIRAASHLYKEAVKAGMGSGCLEVSLQALGAPMHLMDILEREGRKSSFLVDTIERTGLQPTWLAQLTSDVTTQYIDDLLSDRLFSEFSLTPGVVAGYLCLENYPPHLGISNHMTAIPTRDSLPRDIRREMKRNGTYLVIDTSAGGQLVLTLKQLEHYVKHINEIGGKLSIAQIKRPRSSIR